MNNAKEHENELAIVGMACRYPDAVDSAGYWRNIAGGMCSIRRLSEQELLDAGVSADSARDPAYVPMVSRVADADRFDAAYFGVAPNEAMYMDPQRRLLLTCAQEVLEHAGYADGATREEIVGVYVGASNSTYPFSSLLAQMNQLAGKDKPLGDAVDMAALLANGKDFLSTYLSYRLNLTGPSVNINTACSTSLVAVHQACRGLLAYDCDLAIAGGSAIFPYNHGYRHQEGGILSADGHCYAFDARANGTLFGDGVGLVLLKRLADAIADGDTIHAVIKGSAINNDGSDKMNFAAPSVTGQMDVIAEALVCADVSADTISYVEAHGTGTALGDPVEIDALSQVFRTYTRRRQFCAITSVKPNIGHLDAAAGIAGLIKTVEALKHRQLPPSINYANANPQIDFAASPFYVNTQLREWPRGETPRRAGVSSFGIGGTNAHVVLEEAPESPVQATQRPVHLLLLSAKTPTALEAAGARLLQHLQGEGATQTLADIAYTLQVGRTRHAQRRALVADSVQDAIAQLQQDGGQAVAAEASEAGVSLVLLFPGQGSQYLDMGKGLYESEAEFRRQFDRCAELLQPLLGLDLRAAVYPPAGADRAAAAQALNQTRLAQPALFALEYSLAQCLLSYGLEPEAMIGHSLGEYVAACVAGVFTLEEGLHLVARRAQLMQAMAPGAMLSADCDEATLGSLIAGTPCSLAAVNGARSVVASGPLQAIEQLATTLTAQGITHRPLATSHAFHSAMMEPLLAEYRSVLHQVRWQAPQRAYVSNLSGRFIEAAQATDVEYWLRHLRECVRFADGAQTLLAQPAAGRRVLLEAGPGLALGSLLRKQPAAAGATVIASLRHAQDHAGDDNRLFAKALGQLWLAGATLDWKAYHAGERRRRVPLPAYPFEGQRYWIEEDRSARAAAAPSLARREPGDWFHMPSWRLAAPAGLRRSAVPTACCLVFADDGEFNDALLAALGERAGQVVRVRSGRAYACGAHEATIDIAEPAHYQRLFADLRQAGRTVDTVVHAFALQAADADAPFMPAALERSLYSVLFLCQALNDAAAAQPLRLSLLGSGLARVAEDDVIRPEHAVLSGVCRVIAQEFPAVGCRCIDVRVAASTAARSAQAATVAGEVLAPVDEVVIAYRGSQRWCRRFEAVALGGDDAVPALLRPRGVYLISGGLGGMGLALAEHLAATVQARLVLLGRTPLPPRSEWEALLARDDAGARRLRALQRIEAHGGEVLALAADVADAGQLAVAVAAARQRFGSIHGVIHAAGVAGGGVIAAKTRAFVDTVTRPKIAGTVVLDAALAGETLDFFVLCSSMNALVGAFGQYDYCAANAFQDAYAAQRDAQGATRYISLNWDAWKEAGLAADTDIPDYLRAQREQYLQSAISNAEGVQAFSRALAHPLAQWLIATRSPEALLAYQPPAAPAARAAGPAQARPQLAAAYAAPRTPTETVLAEIWQELLGLEQVGINDSFFDLGGDSLLITRLLATIRSRIPQGTQELSLKALFEHSTVAALAALIVEREDSQQIAADMSRLRAAAVVTEAGEI
ncbi:type I polyketide synthase [Tahibacter harae]|uniref:SDR family oxidoreductase n=1 Tax=Tahibacter harae TaxID=2963937 RepID=A0ABT1QM55_9GAMM|nr:type I polyketide synthase [Tahibacter harae]MCQ4163604.1 SDR family oxidoreductase [Tahibacter harae]